MTLAEPFFGEVREPIRYVGPESDDPLAFHWYDRDRVVAGRRMEDHLRSSDDPDPAVFAYAAAQVKHCLDVTHRLGGANYVLRGWA